MSKQVEKIKELIAKRESAKLGGGEKAIEKQHARGKYTARERIDILHIPPASAVQSGLSPADFAVAFSAR